MTYHCHFRHADPQPRAIGRDGTRAVCLQCGARYWLGADGTTFHRYATRREAEVLRAARRGKVTQQPPASLSSQG